MSKKLLMTLVWIFTPVAVGGYIASPGIVFGTGQPHLLTVTFCISLSASIIVFTAISLLRAQ